MKYMLSYMLYLIGDIISRTTMRWGHGIGYSLYSKVMNWSVSLDVEHKIWRPVKPKGKRK
jgi:hypothetical protein